MSIFRKHDIPFNHLKLVYLACFIIICERPHLCSRVHTSPQCSSSQLALSFPSCSHYFPLLSSELVLNHFFQSQ